MFYFLVLTVIFIVSFGCFMFFFFKMTSKGGMFDLLFGYQALLDKMYGSKYKAIQLLEKTIGGCNMCTCFWAAFAWYWVYRFTVNSFEIWQISGFGANIAWCWLFWSVCGWYGLWFINKMKDL